MKQPWKVLAAGIVISTALAGCGTNQGQLGNKNIRNNATGHYNLLSKNFANDGRNEMNRLNGNQQNGNNIIGNHQNYHLSMDKKLSDDLKKLSGVHSAYVFTTDKHAYVAVGLHGHSVTGLTSTGRTAQGYQAQGYQGGMAGGVNQMAGGVNQMAQGVNRTAQRFQGGMAEGVNQLGKDVATGVNNLANNVQRGVRNLTDGTNGIMGQSNYGTIKDRPGSNGYSSYTNGYNAYGTGASTNNRGHLMNGLSDNNNRYMDRELTTDVKNKIEAVVRKHNPRIQNVYVSANPEFHSRMQGYANDVNQGHPINGFTAEFNALVERIFPVAPARNTSYHGKNVNADMKNLTHGTMHNTLYR